MYIHYPSTLQHLTMTRRRYDRHYSHKVKRYGVQNYKPSPMKLEVALVAPSEWRIEPDVVKFEVPAKSHDRQPVHIQLPSTWKPPCPRFAIAADVVCDGKYLGQITEAVVDIA